MKIDFLPLPFSRTLYVTLIGIAIFAILSSLSGFQKRDDDIPVALIGVHHLGADYRINEFYVNRRGGSSIGEGGGGGGHVCCIALPRKWRPGLQAEIRWEVHYNSPVPDQASSPKIEGEGIYKALVPVEAYTKPSDFYIHFFPRGRVRIVVDEFSPIADQHPIKWGDARAEKTATKGAIIDRIFTSEELAELERNLAQERTKHGDWR